ncbi:ABC transporter permease [Paenibacillus psychroresistens]|uniref:ABC transporter permease n=1 Tax=Paenibacillus psychroresistens TaxID=1778678 RepID=A0A6B8RUQ8_9BACL|nr:ABC transporter permease subunit [Paenibacillus psychroresistens]QGQ99667.1 ABC transporter permease [Paenibacillus psychroresistens]
MTQWLVLFKKENLEMWRNHKWLWVPLVFILLGMMNPVLNFYMPQILEANGIAKEVLLTIPIPTAADTMIKTLSQFNTLGILVLVLSFMGTLASERQNGSAIMVLVKPVAHLSYVTTKWAGMFSLTILSFVLGYLAAWYYTGQLIGDVDFAQVWPSLLIYSLWLLFVLSVTLLYSSMLKSTGGIAFLSLLTVAGFSLSSQLLTRYMKWSPGHLSKAAGDLVTKGSSQNQLWLPIGVTIILIIGLIYGAASISKRKLS